MCRLCNHNQAFGAAFDVPPSMMFSQIVKTNDGTLKAVFSIFCGADQSLSRKLLADLKGKSYVEDLATILHIPKTAISIEPTATRKAEVADASSCQEHDTFGQWSKCSKSCGSGKRRRFREHTKCAKGTPHTIRYHQSQPCNKDSC
jgi:hypothetical protein